MGLYVQSNQASLSSLRHLTGSTKSLNKSLEKLSSGYKINHASDGAANLGVSETLRAQLRGSQAAQTNIQQGIGMLQTADAGSQQIYESLQRIRELAVSAGNTSASFSALDAEFQQQVANINQITTSTKYNEQTLLDGSITSLNLQVGANSGDTIGITAAFGNLNATTLGVTLAAIGSIGDSATLVGQVDTALSALNVATGRIGGFVNKLQNQSDMLSVAIENYSAADASIRNTDVATETSNMTRLQILQQAGVMALSQANSQSNVLMRLLQ